MKFRAIYDSKMITINKEIEQKIKELIEAMKDIKEF
jgi:hypothetical protein